MGDGNQILHHRRDDHAYTEYQRTIVYTLNKEKPYKR